MARHDINRTVYDPETSRLVGPVRTGVPDGEMHYLHQRARSRDFFLVAIRADGGQSVRPVEDAEAMAIIAREGIAFADGYATLAPVRVPRRMQRAVADLAKARGVSVNALIVETLERELVGAFLVEERLDGVWIDHLADDNLGRYGWRYETLAILDASRGDGTVDVCLTFEGRGVGPMNAFEAMADEVYADHLAPRGYGPGQVRWWVYCSGDKMDSGRHLPPIFCEVGTTHEDRAPRDRESVLGRLLGRARQPERHDWRFAAEKWLHRAYTPEALGSFWRANSRSVPAR